VAAAAAHCNLGVAHHNEAAVALHCKQLQQSMVSVVDEKQADDGVWLGVAAHCNLAITDHNEAVVALHR
jgi:hypothetical protein